MWATWIFRGVFLFVTIAIFVVASDDTIPDAIKVRAGVYLKAFEMLIYGLSKMVGIDLESKRQAQQDNESESHV